MVDTMEPQTNEGKCSAGLRVSSPKQLIEGDSIDDQVNAINNFAKSLKIDVDKWFPIVKSATEEDIDEQPFKEAIDYFKAHPKEYNQLLVTKIDRFTRGGGAVYDKLKAELKELGVQLIDVEGVIGNREIDTLAHLGLSFTYKWAIQNPTRENELREAENAKTEAQKIARRLIGAEIRYTQQGYCMRRAPYGLKNVTTTTGSGKRKVFAPADTPDFKFICLMFELALKGNLSDQEICDELNTQGYKSPVFNKHDIKSPQKIIGHIGGIRLDVERLRKYLSNPVYAGVSCELWNAHRPIRTPGFSGIVSIDKFNAVNKGRVLIKEDTDGKITIHRGLIAEWRAHKQKDNPEFAYRKYVLCPRCGNPLLGSASTGKGGKRRPAYHCARGHPRFGVKKSTFENTIRDFENAIKLSDDFMNKFIAVIKQEWLNREKEFNNKALNVNSKILDLDKEIEQNLESYSASKSQVIKGMLELRIEKLQNEKLILSSERNKKELEQLDMEKVLKHTRYYMEHLPELLMGSDNPIQNASFFGLLFEKLPTYTELENGTPQLSSIFKLNEEYTKSKSHLVTPTLSISNTMIDDFVGFVKNLMTLFPPQSIHRLGTIS